MLGLVFLPWKRSYYSIRSGIETLRTKFIHSIFLYSWGWSKEEMKCGPGIGKAFSCSGAFILHSWNNYWGPNKCQTPILEYRGEYGTMPDESTEVNMVLCLMNPLFSSPFNPLILENSASMKTTVYAICPRRRDYSRFLQATSFLEVLVFQLFAVISYNLFLRQWMPIQSQSECRP